MSTKSPKVCGQFSKGIAGSISINFGISGGVNCDRQCAYHPESTNANRKIGDYVCYAARLEVRPDRQELKAKLERHEEWQAWQVCGRAIIEIQALLSRGKSIPWVRISTNGSVPQPEYVDRLFATQFKTLLRLCADNGISVHFPVETEEKAQFYRALVGDLVTVRESATSVDRFCGAEGAVSVVAGDRTDNRKQRVEKARQLAKARREQSGRKAIVCPAILNSFASWHSRKDKIPANPRAKCGACTACAENHVDVVYPLH